MPNGVLFNAMNERERLPASARLTVRKSPNELPLHPELRETNLAQYPLWPTNGPAADRFEWRVTDHFPGVRALRFLAATTSLRGSTRPFTTAQDLDREMVVG